MGRKARNKTVALISWAGLLALCLAAPIIPSVPLAAQASEPGGRWEKLKGSSVTRDAPTTTLLADGKVLVAGGDEAGTAQIFDPAGNRWTGTGRMITARSNHRATALVDGRVLVTGGLGKRQGEGAEQTRPALDEAEVYDPKTGAWSVAGSTGQGRFAHISIALKDGRVLIAGGRAGGHDPTLADSQLFDPSTLGWAPAGALGSGRSNFAATRLRDGKVLVTGGWPGGHSQSHADAEIFDPGSGVWTTAGHIMGARRASHSSTLLPDGKVLIAGGSAALIGGGFAAALDSAEIFDPASGDFKATPPMKQRRMEHTATAMPDGKVLLAGFFGRYVDDRPIAPSEIFDPAGGRWAKTQSIKVIPGYHDAMLVKRGCGSRCGVLLIGVAADRDLGPTSNFVEVFRPGSVRVSRGNSTPDSQSSPLGVWAAAAAAIAGFLVVLRRRRSADNAA